jgi:pyruvate dehydrogenase E1 component
VVRVKYGVLQRAAFEEKGGDKLKQWIDNCPNQLYSALTFMGGAVWRKRLMDDLGDQGDVTALIESRSDGELAELMENLGGNCVSTMADAFDSHRPRPADLLPRLHDQGLGHADRRPQGQSRRADEQGPDGRVAAPHGRARGEEWEKFATVKDPDALQAFLDRCRSSPRAGAATPTM